MSENEIADSTGELLTRALSAASEPVYVVGPSADIVDDLVSVMSEASDLAPVRLLAAERPLKDAMSDFIVASRAADLVENDQLALRTVDTPSENPLLVTATDVAAVVTVAGRVAGLSTDDDSFVSDARDQYGAVWEGAKAFDLRTPGLSAVQSTLTDDLGDATATDFGAILDSLQTARGNGDGLDEVTITLLAAAKNGELLYDISKWGEDIGLASKATFSRTKTDLEEMGLIDTEKVPIDVGRPRLRLMLGDDRLTDADADELASVAQSLLAS